MHRFDVMFNAVVKKNGTIMPQFQDLHQVLTNVYVDYQLLKTRGRVTYWSSSLISPFYSTNLCRDSILPTPM